MSTREETDLGSLTFSNISWPGRYCELSLWIGNGQPMTLSAAPNLVLDEGHDGIIATELNGIAQNSPTTRQTPIPMTPIY